MKIEIVTVLQEVALLGSMLELLVIVVDHTDSISLAVRQVARQVTPANRKVNSWYCDKP